MHIYSMSRDRVAYLRVVKIKLFLLIYSLLVTTTVIVRHK